MGKACSGRGDNVMFILNPRELWGQGGWVVRGNAVSSSWLKLSVWPFVWGGKPELRLTLLFSKVQKALQVSEVNCGSWSETTSCGYPWSLKTGSSGQFFKDDQVNGFGQSVNYRENYCFFWRMVINQWQIVSRCMTMVCEGWLVVGER